MLLLACLIYLTVCSANGAPSDEDLDEDLYKRNSLFVRQETCTGQGDCLDSGFNNVSTELVQCNVLGECVCNKCFFLRNKKCATCSQYIYKNPDQTCGPDNRPSHVTALLFSIFLFSTGAANFYIGQIRLGAVQLLLLLITITGCLGLCGCIFCLYCSDDETSESGCLGCSCGNCIMLTWSLTGSFIIGAWWIADIVIFVLNLRPSGAGCPLA